MKTLRGSKAKRGARKMSWLPGRKGQGGEGVSHGYGGSAGDGTGASGPETGQRSKPEDNSELHKKINNEGEHSPSLPSRDKISRVLR